MLILLYFVKYFVGKIAKNSMPRQTLHFPYSVHTLDEQLPPTQRLLFLFAVEITK